MRTSPFAWLDALLFISFFCLLPEPGIRIFPALEPQHVKATTFQGRVIYTEEGARVPEGETSAGWDAVARSPDGRPDIMFGPVFTTEAHLACAEARLHSNNIAGLSSIVEALSFLGPSGKVARDSDS